MQPGQLQMSVSVDQAGEEHYAPQGVVRLRREIPDKRGHLTYRADGPVANEETTVQKGRTGNGKQKTSAQNHGSRISALC